MSGLTTKAEPPPTRDVNRDSGTASANGGWLGVLLGRGFNLYSHTLLPALDKVAQPYFPATYHRLALLGADV